MVPEITPNYNQTLTIESVFQYRMDYGVNFQIKKKMNFVPSFPFVLVQN